MLLPIVRKSLVEGSVFILGDVIGLSHPDWLGLVEDLILMGDLLDSLLLLLLWGLRSFSQKPLEFLAFSFLFKEFVVKDASIASKIL